MKTTNAQVLEKLILNKPGQTEMQLATAIFHGEAYQQRVNEDCRLLINRGVVERRGEGGPADPFRYYPTSIKKDNFKN